MSRERTVHPTQFMLIHVVFHQLVLWTSRRELDFVLGGGQLFLTKLAARTSRHPRDEGTAQSVPSFLAFYLLVNLFIYSGLYFIALIYIELVEMKSKTEPTAEFEHLS
jgi:hypothetical protein